MARAEKNEKNCLIIEFIFLCQQQGCKKVRLNASRLIIKFSQTDD